MEKPSAEQLRIQRKLNKHQTKSNLQRHTEINKKLIDEQQTCRDEYDKKISANTDISAENTKLKDNITNLHKTLQTLCPSKTLPTIENIGRPATVSTPPQVAPSRPMSVPTAAATAELRWETNPYHIAFQTEMLTYVVLMEQYRTTTELLVTIHTFHKEIVLRLRLARHVWLLGLLTLRIFPLANGVPAVFTMIGVSQLVLNAKANLVTDNLALVYWISVQLLVAQR